MASYSISPVDATWGAGLVTIPGLGSLASGQQIAMSTVSSAGSILGSTTPLWTAATWAIPVIGAAVAGITLALMAIFSRKGPKQKTATTQFAEETIKALQDNLAAYMAGPRTRSSQAQALANFDAGWAFLTSQDACGNPEMGDPGLRCIFERQPVGTCTMAQADAAHEPLSDCGKYSMARDLRDPIANDPNVKADPILDGAGNLIDSLTGGIFSSGAGSGNTGLLLLAGGAILLALTMGGDHK